MNAPKLRKGWRVRFGGDTWLVLRVTECSAIVQRVAGKDKRPIHISPNSEVERVA